MVRVCDCGVDFYVFCIVFMGMVSICLILWNNLMKMENRLPKCSGDKYLGFVSVGRIQAVLYKLLMHSRAVTISLIVCHSA